MAIGFVLELQHQLVLGPIQAQAQDFILQLVGMQKLLLSLVINSELPLMFHGHIPTQSSLLHTQLIFVFQQ
jgi:hypothetical protein